MTLSITQKITVVIMSALKLKSDELKTNIS